MDNESTTHNVQTSSIPIHEYDDPNCFVPGNHAVAQIQTSDLENSELLLGQSSVPRVISHEQNDEPICLYSSDGSKFWIPNVPSHEKPSIGIQFKTWDDAVRMYKAYAAKAGFDVRMSTITWTKGAISHRYMVCSKAGTPRCKDVDTMDTSSSSSKRRHTNIKVIGCNACIKLKVPSNSVGFEIYDFIEAHNHGLVSFGPVVAHRVQSSLKGGQRLVTGSKTDFKNHARNVRYCVADADAQMIVDRFTHNMSHLEDFFFQFKAVDGVLRSIFWSDGISRCNYSMFGEVLAFDATYSTNRHDIIFVPFTGVDCHKKCVTFGAGLIHSETIDSYQWLLHAFLSLMLKGEIQVNEEIRCRVNKLVWNVFIKPEMFESRWHDLIDEFNLSENKWLKDMFAIRESWAPAYFRDIPMCCLMKTSSRSESCNS
ncbi:protein FAR1-RELATED SEQUENCE 5-like [Bidens hawaiensis]|uniref:protein FAR1-RELATED SEQUENCE 5-like n=1 Tax=Bidens hawaiensis TaxID=980011 RepID=UPI0040495A67